MSFRDGFAFTRIASATTTQVKIGPGRLVRVINNTPVASSTIDLIDNTAGTTINIGRITNTADVKPYAIDYDLHFTQGLRIITSGADQLTFVWE